MLSPTASQTTCAEPASWQNGPTGGTLSLQTALPEADISLEVVFAHGRAYWFLHVLGVPFEVEAGAA